jgi:3-hydroxyisobutyrate dehydrogenase-like beta-hydroxyacid dehydrogenase
MSDRIIVGLVGTGKMGKPMALNLLKAEFAVVVHNRSRGSVEELVQAGARNGESYKGVADAADIILTSLTNQQSARDVYLGRDGLVANAREGQIYIETSTNPPELIREVAEALAARGASFLDAPVSGGVAGADAGTLTVMIGGDQETFERARPVLEVIGGNLHLLGDVGAGTVVKLVNQLLVGINMAPVAEGLVLGVKAGADPRKMLEVLSTSFGGSRMLDRGVPLIVDRNFSGGTPVDLIRKDLGIIRDVADSLGVPLATGEEASRVFDHAAEAGFGPNDMTAIVRPLEDATGIEIS